MQTNLKSQDYLNKINKWTEDHKMVINLKKMKAMVFNFTNNHQFTTHLQLKGENIEIVKQMKTRRVSLMSNSDIYCKVENWRIQSGELRMYD